MGNCFIVYCKYVNKHVNTTIGIYLDNQTMQWQGETDNNMYYQLRNVDILSGLQYFDLPLYNYAVYPNSLLGF